MGDSAGGNLALSLVVQATANGVPRPAGLVLLSPCLDASLSDPAITALDHTDPIVPAHGAAELARMYAGTLDTHDPVVSPLFADLNGLPPIALFTGTHEILNSDARRFRQRADHSGVPLSWHEYPAMLHVWPLFPIPEARRALDEIAAFVANVGVR